MILGRDESAHVKLTFVILSFHKPFTWVQEPISKNICQYFCKCIQRLTFYLCFRLFDIGISIIHVLCKNERLINQYLMTLWNDSKQNITGTHASRVCSYRNIDLNKQFERLLKRK